MAARSGIARLNEIEPRGRFRYSERVTTRVKEVGGLGAGVRGVGGRQTHEANRKVDSGGYTRDRAVKKRDEVGACRVPTYVSPLFRYSAARRNAGYTPEINVVDRETANSWNMRT